MIKIDNQDLVIKGNTIIEGMNIEIEKSNVILLTGINGSGKSLFLRYISGLMENSFTDDVESRGVVIEKSKLVPEMSGIEFLKFLNGLNKENQNKNDEKAIELIEYFNVDKFKDKKIRTYSLGTKHKYALIQAFMHSPELILLDEPTDTLDEISVTRLYKLINQEIKKGTSFVIVSHNPSEIKNEINFNRHLHIEDETITERTIN